MNTLNCAGELWHLFIYFENSKIMIFGTLQDQYLDINIGGHTIDLCTDFKYLEVILAEIGTSTKQSWTS